MLFNFLYKYFPKFAKKHCPHSWGGYKTFNLLHCWKCNKIIILTFPPYYAISELNEINTYARNQGKDLPDEIISRWDKELRIENK